MATLALSLAGNFVGGLVGGPFGATLGRALGALAGSAIDGMLFGEEKPKPTGGDFRLQGSSEGGAVPRLYGWSRLSGNIIWARELELLSVEHAGAKGLAPQPDSEDEVGASFAVAFCEGEVHRLGRIWADGQLLDTNGLTLRFYRGTEDQLPDGLIEATQGVAPAYRGLCYLVVEQLPLSRFGNRIPQLSVELCRVVGDLEPAIRAVTVIPGATEFGYDPSPRVRLVRRGETVGENTHVAKSVSDWTWSIDELTALCPNLERVALVVAWFGNDLRCGHCTVGPRVESASRTIEGTSWSVAGQSRGQVPVVSSHGGGPAYGGTPSDAAVKAAIADLRARGIAVTLYPMILMDVPSGNGLPNPYAGTGQPAYPWRGRITCHPAPGQAGSPDRTGAAASQVASFVAAGYRTMMLHYAQLAQAGGGVDAILIGSEMVGLTTVRGAANSFPFVDALVTLAGEVRAIVGAGTKITYAADWSEYSGYQPNGENFFHLDPLWASSHIDAVGIDNYMPLADWRDGTEHADAALATSGYELDYLAGNVAGGEGFDWYYASAADRQAGVRSPISDGAYGEPFVYRVKDIRGWWSQWHYNRPSGVRSAVPTAWVPGSKPIWFTELGCGAVDKGANQPNIFGDDKSAESGRPYFSSGMADPLIQRQFLRAHQRYWVDAAHNPAGMVDLSRIYHWTWDARPFPAFPTQAEVWADGPNYRTGHWLTGRLGAMSSGEMAAAVAADHGVTLAGEPGLPLVQGFVLGDITTGRDALEPLLTASGLSLRAGAQGLRLGQAKRVAANTIDADALVREDGAVLSLRRGDPAEAPGRLALTFIDRERDYQIGTVTALRGAGPVSSKALPLVLDLGGARVAAEQGLLAESGQRESLEFSLPPSDLVLEPGDVVDLGLAEGPFEITEIRDAAVRRVTARTLVAPVTIAVAVDPARTSGASAVSPSRPIVLAAHLPPEPDESGRTRLALAAHAQPWPGVVGIADGNGTSLTRLSRRAVMGEVVGTLGAGQAALWDPGALTVALYAGHLVALDEPAVLAGGNRLAVQTDSGEWEIIAFAQAELIAPATYRLTRLLRGQDGSVAAMGPVSESAPVFLLDGRAGVVPVGAQWLGTEASLTAYAGSGDLTGTRFDAEFGLGPILPLAPVHLKARRIGGDIVFDWTRCSRADGDGWGAGDAPLEQVPERYAVRIHAGTTQIRTLECGAPTWTYSAADQILDFGATAPAFDFTVQQISPVFGPGHHGKGSFDG